MRTLGVASASHYGGPSDPSVILFDDFLGTSVDLTKWDVYDRLPDMFNNELNCCTADNVTVSGSMLRITAIHEDHVCGDTTTVAPNPRTMNYTSGHISQKLGSTFLYGTIDIRAKIPGGTGVWPCLWMLDYSLQSHQIVSSWETGGYPTFYAEIDIAEFMGNNRNGQNSQIHWVPPPGGSQVDPGGIVGLPYNVTTRFQVYRFDWRAGSAIFSVDCEDGVGFRVVQTITSAPGVLVPDIPMYVTMNLAVGGVAGPPNPATFPLTMEVDYVRVTDEEIPMTVLKQYNTGNSQWEAVVVGGPGPTGPVGPAGPAGGLPATFLLSALNTAITDADVVAGLGGSAICTGVWIGTAAQYAAIGTKGSTVVYFVTP